MTNENPASWRKNQRSISFGTAKRNCGTRSPKLYIKLAAGHSHVKILPPGFCWKSEWAMESKELRMYDGLLAPHNGHERVLMTVYLRCS